MNRVTLLFTLFFTSLGAATFLKASDAEWMHNFQEAREIARAEDKTMLVLFTGSQWCPPCQQLEKNVFASNAFADYARQSLVLVELDFDRRGQPTSTEFKAQHNRLKTRMKIRGFPTVILFDSKGEVIERTGFRRGSPEQYVDHLKKLVKGSA